jgi:hypothetical protein
MRDESQSCAKNIEKPGHEGQRWRESETQVYAIEVEHDEPQCYSGWTSVRCDQVYGLRCGMGSREFVEWARKPHLVVGPSLGSHRGKYELKGAR